MVRSTLIAAGAALLCGASFAQQATEAIPITSPIRQGPTFNMHTGQRINKARAAQLRAPLTTVYNNTCAWTGGAFYTGTGSCETYIDEGIIPGGVGDPLAGPLGATADNNIMMFQIGYCTNFVVGSVDIKVGFYDSLGGSCVGGIAPTPPSLVSQAAGLAPQIGYFQLNAANGWVLPGDATPGGTGVNCWIVNIQAVNTGFCIKSDGDGVWDNIDAQDQFNWSWEMDNVIVSGTAASGILLAGEPSVAANACTYNVPCGGPTSTCGHGYGSEDLFWINVDNDIAGDTTNTGVTCVSAPSAGTNCYWFGGYPGNPFAGAWMVMGSNGSCGGCNGSPVTYCTSGTTSASTGSCVATIGLASGIPSASNAGPAIVTSSNLPDNKSGLIFLGATQAAAAWGPNGHFLCIAAPTQRTAAQNSGGTPGNCDGVISIDLNSVLATSGFLGNPATAGTVVLNQCWFRDPGSSKTTAMSNGLSVTLCP